MNPTFPAWIPRPAWLAGYRGADLAADGVAGLIVAILLVPQAMAYALLAGLPVEVGLYASIVPVALYALVGSSRTLAVGPVAVVSLLVAGGLSGLAAPGSGEYLALALLLALLVGAIQALMGWLRLGFLVHFLSHAVLVGFTSAAALVIAGSQLGPLLGISLTRGGTLFELLGEVAGRITTANPATLAIGAGSIAILVLARQVGERVLCALGVPAGWRAVLTRTGPFVAVALGIAAVQGLDLDSRHAVATVGAIPRGLPTLTAPPIDGSLARALLPTALAITFVGFLESFAVAKSLAARRREKVDADRELVALGLANISAAVTGGYPVAGGFSRSMVNFAAGARSGAASLVTAGLVASTLLLLTPVFAALPRAALAAVIVVAVLQLVDLKAPARFWRYSRADAMAYLATFLVVLGAGVEAGIVAGAALALVLHLWRTTRPHLAIVGRVGSSEHFRNIRRHRVTTWPDVLLVRIDESLYFGNAQRLEERLLAAVADRPRVRHLVLIASAVNFIDASALDVLNGLATDLRTGGVTLHLTEVKGPVMDRLHRVRFLDDLAPGQVFLSTQEAVNELASATPVLVGPLQAGPEAGKEPIMKTDGPVPRAPDSGVEAAPLIAGNGRRTTHARND